MLIRRRRISSLSSRLLSKPEKSRLCGARICGARDAAGNNCIISALRASALAPAQAEAFARVAGESFHFSGKILMRLLAGAGFAAIRRPSSIKKRIGLRAKLERAR